MSRIIKFRVWFSDEGRFLKPEEFHIDGHGNLIVKLCIYDDAYDFQIQQFTGFLAKGGKEIYEGDILYTNFGEKGNEDDPFVEIRKSVTRNNVGYYYNGELLYHYCGAKPAVELIGNIYQNNNLLTSDNKNNQDL